MKQPLYTTDILRLAASIPYLGGLAEAEGRGEARSPTCGSTVLVEVRLDRNGCVAALGQKVQACAFGQASAALMGANAVGRSAEDVRRALAAFASWLDEASESPGGWPGLEALAPARSRPARHGAMLLPFRALLAAIEDAAAAAEPQVGRR